MHLPRLFGLFVAVLFCISAQSAPRLNVIFILTDDLGWSDLGCYGSKFYETPNLDKLASQGVRFTSGYAACNVCSPTRASIMTGKHPARLRITDWLPGRPDRPDQKLRRPILQQHLPLEEVTLAEALKVGGYRTAFVGKWHLGGSSFYPDKQGFDINVGGCEKGHPPSYFSPYGIPTLADGPKGEFLTERLTDECLKFIESSREQPFLLYLAHYTVHTPLQAKPELVATFRSKAAGLKSGEPEFITDHGRQVRQVQNHAVYAAMVNSLDQSVGRIMSKLEELGLEKKTAVFFTSDNGGLSTSEGTPTSNLPLRLGKGWNFEGGVRVPLIVKWPDAARPGTLCNDPVLSTDFYPTILEMTGLPLKPDQHLDGASFVTLLKGGNRGEHPQFWHYPHYSNQGGPPSGAIRVGPWKLIESFEDMSVELYNLNGDPGEQNELSAAQPGKTKELRERLHNWRKEIGAAMPSANPDYNPEAGAKKKGGKS